MLCLSGSVVSIMTSTCDWASLSSTVPVSTRGGKMDGRTVPATEPLRVEKEGRSLFFLLRQITDSGQRYKM